MKKYGILNIGSKFEITSMDRVFYILYIDGENLVYGVYKKLTKNDSIDVIISPLHLWKQTVDMMSDEIKKLSNSDYQEQFKQMEYKCIKKLFMGWLGKLVND